MASDPTFADFDNEAIYSHSLALVLDESTRNFVVDFGQKEARIAFNLDVDTVDGLLKAGLPKERPVRWMYVVPPGMSHDQARSDQLCFVETYGLRIGRRTLLIF